MPTGDPDPIKLAPGEVARLIIDHAPEYAIMIIDRDGRIMTWSEGAERITGYSAEEAIGMPFGAIFTEPDQAAGEDKTEMDRAWRDGQAEDCRWHRRKDGRRFWGNGMTMALRTERLQGFVKIMRDETSNRLADEQRLLLLNELNHRINNTLTTVQSMVEQTLRAAEIDPGVRDDLGARLQALSRAHAALVEQNWAGADLTALIERSLTPYRNGKHDRFVLDGPQVRLSPAQTVPISLVLHELATNAVKHGALSTDTGRVSVTWNTSEDFAGDRRMTLLWAESRGPRVRQPSRRGFGSRLLERSFPPGSGGEVQIAYDPEGLRCVLRINLSRGPEQAILDVAAEVRSSGAGT